MTIPPTQATEATSNLITNPWFALNVTGWAVGGATMAHSADRPLGGPGLARITATGAEARIAVNMTIPATPHTITFWLRHEMATAKTFSLLYNVTLYSGVAVAPGVWTPLSTTVAGTGGATSVQVRMIGSVAGDVYDVGHVLVEPGTRRTSPCPEIDAAGNVLSGSAWTGAPHASSSTRAEKRTSGFHAIGSSTIGPLRAGKA